MITDYYANKALDAIVTTAGTMNVGLSTTKPVLSPSVAAGATNITEPTGGSYARLSLATGDWNAAADRIKATNATLTFPLPSGDWGAVGWVVVWSGTKVVFFGDLAQKINVTSGSDQISIPAGTISLYLPN